MVPLQIKLGDTTTFRFAPYVDVQNRKISPPTWVFSTSFRGNGIVYDISADHMGRFTIPAVNFLKPGRCYFQVHATNVETSERITIDSGQVEVIADFKSAEGTFDPRSQTRKDLDTVRTLIRQLLATGGVVEYRIGSRSARKYDLADLRAEESKLLFRLAREEKNETIKKGLGDPHSKYVRFR